MIKKLIALFAFVTTAAFAGPNDLTIQQRNAVDNGNITRTLISPATDGVIYYNASTLLPGYLTFGAGLTVSNGVLSAAALPTLSTVAYTGQYADVKGTPVLSTVASTGSYTDLLNKPTLFSGNYNDLTNKPTIPTQTPFNFGDPVTRTLAANTVYQANDPTKAAVITVTSACTASLSLTAGGTCTMQIKTANASGLTCSTGTLYGTITNANTGTLTIGLGLNQRVGSVSTINLRGGSYFMLCPTSGTFDISAVDQSAG